MGLVADEGPRRAAAPPAPGPWVFAAILLAYAVQVERFWFLNDDAFISFRYARNLASGAGLRFNAREAPPVEGYSNFLWTLLCAAFEYFHLEVTFWPLVVSALGGATLLALVFATLRRRLETDVLVAALATLALATFPPFAVWSTSGLETMPFALCMFAAFERLVLRRDGPDGLGGGAAALLMALLRPEGVAWAVLIIALAWLSRWLAGEGSARALAVCAAALAAGVALHVGWRYAYYGALLPNSVHVKAYVDAPRLVRGFNYVATNVLTFPTLLLAIPGSVVALRRGRRALGTAVVAMAWAVPAYAVVVTGDFMAMGRFLVPGFAFDTVLLGWLLADVRAWAGGRVAAPAAVGVATAVLGLLPGWNLHLVPRAVLERLEFRASRTTHETEYERWKGQRKNAHVWAKAGRALRSYAAQRRWSDPPPSVVLGAIGAVGYYSGLEVLDRFGLVTPEVGRRPLDPADPLQTPGHDMSVPWQYFLKDEPTIVAHLLVWNDDPDTVAAVCAEWAERLRRESPADLPRRYAPDVVRVPELDARGGAAYLLTWARIGDGVGWDAFERRLEALRAGGVP